MAIVNAGAIPQYDDIPKKTFRFMRGFNMEQKS